MAYFDSAKNRAKWQKELNELRKERDRRALSGFQANKAKPEQNQKRVRVTFAQLEAEEYEEARAKKIEQQKKRELAKENSLKENSIKENSIKEKTELSKSKQEKTL